MKYLLLALLSFQCYSQEVPKSTINIDSIKTEAYLAGVKYTLASKGYDKSWLSHSGDTLYVNEVTNCMILNDLSKFQNGNRIKTKVIDDNRWFKKMEKIDRGL